MIVLRTDYSPQIAPELQERENMMMMEACLYLAGMSGAEIERYHRRIREIVKAYESALGFPDDAGKYRPEQWEAAKQAAAAPLKRASLVLAKNGVTIINTLKKPQNDGFFHHIETRVLGGIGRDKEDCVAVIERPITDIEAETYEDNMTGYAAEMTVAGLAQ